jgi:hypothetical protein
MGANVEDVFQAPICRSAAKKESSLVPENQAINVFLGVIGNKRQFYELQTRSREAERNETIALSTV